MVTREKTTKESVTSAHETDSPVKSTRPAKVAASPRARKTEPVTARLETKTVSEKSVKAENKPRKMKMVRDSFTMPEMDYSQLGELKKKCLRAGVHVKKSELLRAGLLNLAKLPDAALVKAVEAVEKLKTGRPAKV